MRPASLAIDSGFAYAAAVAAKLPAANHADGPVSAAKVELQYADF